MAHNSKRIHRLNGTFLLVQAVFILSSRKPEYLGQVIESQFHIPLLVDGDLIQNGSVKNVTGSRSAEKIGYFLFDLLLQVLIALLSLLPFFGGF